MEKEPITAAMEQIPIKKDSYETVGTENGPNEFIKDPEDTKKLAYSEIIGKEALDITFNTMERGLEIELTPEQKQNVEIMNGLLEKYPHAFNEATDENGMRVLAAKPGNLGIWIWKPMIWSPLRKADNFKMDFKKVFESTEQSFLISKDGIWQFINRKGFNREDFLNQKSYNFTDKQYDFDKHLDKDNPILLSEVPDNYGRGSRNFRDLAEHEMGVLKQIFENIEKSHNNDTFPTDKEQLTAESILYRL